MSEQTTDLPTWQEAVKDGPIARGQCGWVSLSVGWSNYCLTPERAEQLADRLYLAAADARVKEDRRLVR